MAHHNKVYSTAEETQRRLKNFADNSRFVREFDAKRSGFTVALNQFADLTVSEYRETVLGFRRSVNPRPAVEVDVKPLPGLPASFDWRDRNAVSEVKNQGQCGSCWAMSTTGTIEGAHAIKTGKLVSLSEQNLMDCSVAEGNQGCNGGLMDQGYQYVIKNKGIDTEASYPYLGTGPNDCKFNPKTVGATVASYVDVPVSETALLNAVSIVPVANAIDGSHQSFMFYQSGIYNETQCSSQYIDHSMTVIGWGVDKEGTEYWICKNSWGTAWGMKGFVYMLRNKNNQCGIASECSYVKV